MSPKEKLNMSINTIPENVTESSPDVQLDKAFADIVEQYEKSGTSTLPTSSDDNRGDTFNDNKDDSTANQDEVTLNQSQTDTSNVGRDAQPADQQISDIKYDRAFTTDDNVSVQQLKEELRKKEIDIQLQHSRLNDLSARYQELKAYTDLLTKSSHETPNTSTSSGEHYKSPEVVKEFFELYPDMAEAVSQMIEAKTSATTRSFEEALNNRVIPIQQHLEKNATQQFINKVLSAHPDAPQIVQSQALRTWAETLDPVLRSGVNTVMQYGNADEVIALLNQYKQNARSTGISTNNSMSSSTGNVATRNSTQASRDDEIARRVLSMLNLPSNTQEPAMIKQSNTPVYANVADAFEALCLEQENKRK